MWSFFLFHVFRIYFVLFFLQWSKRPKPNLSDKKQDSNGYKGSDQEKLRCFFTSHIQYMCLTENNKNNRSTNYNT